MRPLGTGGNGQVFLARDTRLGRKVALKVIRHRSRLKANGVQRFIEEAKNTARFNHPNIVTLYEVGEYRGAPYLALEYLNGQTLQKRIRAGELTVQEILRIVSDVASALFEAHRHDVLHLDLKPGNIIIAKDGRLRVLDFGLAQRIRFVDDDPHRLEALPVFAGTPAYMAPEQWKQAAVTPATDIWALGVIMYEMIAGGSRPYEMSGIGMSAMADLICRPEPAPRLSPSDRHAELVARCLQKDPAQRPSAEEVAQILRTWLSGPSSSRATYDNPFRGFLPFTFRHAGQFYGRAREIEELVERLRDEPTMPIVGASGAGKSSFVRAGVVPRLLEQGDWVVRDLRPGLEPFKGLAHQVCSIERNATASGSWDTRDFEAVETVAAELYAHPQLLSARLERCAVESGAKILLVVDQLEELYTLNQDQELQSRFITAIAQAADDAADPIRVIFTVRDDFLHCLAAAGSQVRAVLRRMMLIQVPERAALLETLKQPVMDAGYAFEDESIIGAMVDAVGNKPSSLPLLQFAARKLWDQRDRSRRLLTRQAYAEIGGVTGVLAQHADGVLARMVPTEVQITRQILLRLVTPEGTRRLVPEADVLESLGPDAVSVLTRLREAHLVARSQKQDQEDDDRILELAHESLIKTWHRFQRWIEEGQGELRFLNEVGQAAEMWERRGARDDEVWAGDALAEALRLRRRLNGPAPERVERFLEAGQRRALLQERRRRRWSTIGVAGLALMVAVLFYQRQEAVEQKKQAEEAGALARQERTNAERERSEAQREAAVAAYARKNVLEARAKLRTSLETNDSTMARALWWRIRDEALYWRRATPDVTMSLRVSPDGQTIATVTTDASVYLYDIVTGTRTLLHDHGAWPTGLAYSPNGQLASGGEDGVVHLWAPQTGKARSTFPASTSRIRYLAFGDDDTLAVADETGKVAVWQLADRKIAAEFSTQGVRIRSMSFHGGVGRLTVAAGPRFMIFDVKARSSKTILAHDKTIDAAELSPDGRWVATAGRDERIKLWSALDGSLIRTIHAPGHVYSISFSPNGERIAAVGNASHVDVFETSTGRRLAALEGPVGRVRAVRFSADGRWVVASGKYALWVWDTPDVRATAALSSHRDGVVTAAFHPDGRSIATGGYDQTLRFWDRSTGRVLRMRTYDEDVWNVDFHPSGQQLAWAGRSVRQIDVSGVASDVLVKPPSDHRWKNRFDPTGRRMAVARDRLALYELGSDQPPVELARSLSNAYILDIDFSPDGRWLAGGLNDGTLRVWDTHRLKTPVVLRGHTGRDVWSVEFDSTGRFIASSGKDGTIRWWDWKRGTHRIVGRHPTIVHWLDVSPDDRFIAAPGMDRRLRVWRVDTATLAYARRIHHADVNSARYSPDGQAIVTTSDDGTVRLTDAETGRPLWKTVALLAASKEILTHTGWSSLSPREPRPATSARWRRHLASQAARAVEMDGTPWLCVVTEDERLEIWHREEDRRLGSWPSGEVFDLMPSAGGCLVSSHLGVHRYEVDQPPLDLVTLGPEDSEPLSIATRGDQIGVGRRKEILLFDTQGHNGLPVRVRSEITALAFDGPNIWVGFLNGTLQLVSRAGRVRVGAFQGVPVSPVTRLVPGPRGTILAGFQNGTVGIWNLENQQLERRHDLHGPIRFLQRHGSSVFAASELGWHVMWDLSLFDRPYCELLEEVWVRVPVVWSRGRVLAKRPPARHSCRLAPL